MYSFYPVPCPISSGNTDKKPTTTHLEIIIFQNITQIIEFLSKSGAQINLALKLIQNWINLLY